jgi:hypothetical protein
MSLLYGSTVVIALLSAVAAPTLAAAGEEVECPESISDEIEGDALDGYLVDSAEAPTFMVVGTNVVLIGRSVTGYYATSDGEVLEVYCGLHPLQAN